MSDIKISTDTCYDSEDSKFTPSLTSPDGEIKSYNLEQGLLYPHVILTAKTMPRYRIQVLANVLQKTSFIHEKVPKGYYNVYLSMSGKLLGLGMVHSDNLKSLLVGDLYREIDKHIMLSPTERVDGEMMFALCTSPLY